MSKLQQLAHELEEELNRVVEEATPTDYSEIGQIFVDHGWLFHNQANDKELIKASTKAVLESYRSLQKRNDDLIRSNNRLREELYGGDEEPEEVPQEVPPPTPQWLINPAAVQQQQAEANQALSMTALENVIQQIQQFDAAHLNQNAVVNANWLNDWTTGPIGLGQGTANTVTGNQLATFNHDTDAGGVINNN